ncbi:MAG: hypothetical protein ABWZ42_09690 [Ilumatobacteraceae bacterium]
MKKKLITMIAAGTLVLAACGSDSDDGASDAEEATEDTTGDVQEEAADTTDAVEEDAAEPPSDVQEEAANTVIAATRRDGIELDAACVNDLTSQLSDEDAQEIVDAEAESDAAVSAEGTAIVSKLLSCAGNDEIIDAFIEQLNTSGQEFDEECVREGLEDIDLAELAASQDGQSGTPEEVISAVFDCFELGS